MEKRATVAQRCFSKDPPPSLPLGNTARRAQGLCTSLLPLVGASFRLPADSGRSAGFLRAPPPPEWGVGGTQVPAGLGQCTQPQGTEADKLHLSKLQPRPPRVGHPLPAPPRRGKPAILAFPSNTLPRREHRAT